MASSVSPPAGLERKKSISKGSTQPCATRAPLFSSPQVRKCTQMLNKLMKHKLVWMFMKPVNTLWPDLRGYDRIIKNPMDLGTVKSTLSNGGYKTPHDFAGDVRLTFKNAMAYNTEDRYIYDAAHNLLSLFENLFKSEFESKDKQEDVSLPVEPAPLGDKGRKIDNFKLFEDLLENVSVAELKVMLGIIEKTIIKKMGSELKKNLMDLPPVEGEKAVRIANESTSHVELEIDTELLDNKGNKTLWELVKLVKDHQMVVGRMTREPSPVPAIQHEEGKEGGSSSASSSSASSDSSSSDSDYSGSDSDGESA